MTFNKGGNCSVQLLTLLTFSFSALKICFKKRYQPLRALDSDGGGMVFGRLQSFLEEALKLIPCKLSLSETLNNDLEMSTLSKGKQSLTLVLTSK